MDDVAEAEWMKYSLIALPLALGCLASHASEEEGAPVLSHRAPPGHAAGPTLETTPEATDRLAACLLAGGRLSQAAAVNNNDVVDHGAVTRLAASPAGELAVVARDGTIKFWTLEGLIGSVDNVVLSYGAEIPTAESTDLVWGGDRFVAGDERGAVFGWKPDESFPSPIGDAPPGNPIVAVAADQSGTLIAHADTRDHGHIVVRNLATGDIAEALPTAMDSVRDLAFTPDGRLIVAGHAASGVTIELRGHDPAVIERTIQDAELASVEEIAVAAQGSQAAVVGDGFMILFDHASDAEPSPARDFFGHEPTSVDLSLDGRVVFSVGARSTGLRVSKATSLGPRELQQVDIDNPVAVRVHPAGDLLFVASEDGNVRAFSCTPS